MDLSKPKKHMLNTCWNFPLWPTTLFSTGSKGLWPVWPASESVKRVVQMVGRPLRFTKLPWRFFYHQVFTDESRKIGKTHWENKNKKNDFWVEHHDHLIDRSTLNQKKTAMQLGNDVGKLLYNKIAGHFCWVGKDKWIIHHPSKEWSMRMKSEKWSRFCWF